jgi:hypothetical protein
MTQLLFFWPQLLIAGVIFAAVFALAWRFRGTH